MTTNHKKVRRGAVARRPGQPVASGRTDRPPGRHPAKPAGAAVRRPRVDGSWDEVAGWYESIASEHGTEFHQNVIVPGLLRLLDLQAGERVCDLACGQGAVTQALARANGVQVTGVDLSPRLIDLAKRRASPNVKYIVGNARDVKALQAGTFDAVTCVLAAMNIEPVEPLFLEMSRLLRGPVKISAPVAPNQAVVIVETAGATSMVVTPPAPVIAETNLAPLPGQVIAPSPGRATAPASGAGEKASRARAVIVILHPAFRIPRQSRWKWDEGRKLLVREVDRYLSPLKVPIDMRPFDYPGETMTFTYHRPIGDYIGGLAKAGFVIESLEEWPSHRVSQPGPKAKAENRARDEFPLFLAIRAVKV